MPGVFRNLWGPQQQIARLMAQQQTSVTLGLPDYDPTVRAPTGGSPWQQRTAPNAVPAVEANYLQRHLWQASTPVDVFVPDADPTVRTPWSYANPYQLRWRDS